ncbi:sulfatase-like hydrolase/transferase, partial [Marinobacter sp.]|uniref:sulfatase-like hydrolase/transferase n=1 Tax=Marinobacter sp. TaxID=50741 RepID=UPI0034A1972D
AFSSIPDLRLKTPGEAPWDRDVRITDDWLAFTHSERNPEQPFFGFLFYDTPHGHRVPEDYPVKFQPYWKSVNKLALDQNFNPELIKNNYKSTLHFVDNQVDRVLDDLRARDLLDSTIVVITGDHGQEFNEYGMNYWGHGSNFGQYQLRVPMMVHWPGQTARRINYRTEHFEMAPTLMKGTLGCSATPSNYYATGKGLFMPPKRQWSIAHSYMDYALLLNDMMLVSYPSGSVDALDYEMKPAKDYRLNPIITAEILRELSKFYE